MMDFVELEAIEGLRWSWNSWPASKAEAASLVIPLSIMCTPLMESSELPILPYEPLICVRCGAALNPYARVDYQSKIWLCPFCNNKNLFPKTYGGIGENNLPAELFPTYSIIEYQPGKSTVPLPNSSTSLNMRPNWGNGMSSSSLSSLMSTGNSSNTLSGVSDPRVVNTGPAFVFVVDLCMAEDELRALKNELLFIMSQLPENALVGLVTFDSMVKVYDLGFADCIRVVIFHGDRELSSTEPSDYERPFFRGCTEEDARNQWTKQPLKMEVGNVNSKHFVLALNVKSVLDPREDDNEENKDVSVSLGTDSAQEDVVQILAVRSTPLKKIDMSLHQQVDCSPLLQGEPCYEPDSVNAHATYAVNAYYQMTGRLPDSCDFNDVAEITTTDPSHGNCTLSEIGGINGTFSNATAPISAISSSSRGSTLDQKKQQACEPDTINSQGSDDTKDPEEDEHQLNRVKEWITSVHLEKVEITDVLANFPDISMVLIEVKVLFYQDGL